MEIKDFVSVEERILQLVRKADEWKNDSWVILGEPTPTEIEILCADEITLGKYPDTVIYRKILEKEYYYVECTRNGRKRLANFATVLCFFISPVPKCLF